MSKFFVAFAIFVSIILIACYDSKANDDHFLAIIKTKHKRLEQLPSPKVVLVGGSNLSFGVDTKRLEKSIHKPVVNMGLSASFGLKYMLREVAPYLGNGDMCVVSPEYEHFYMEPSGRTGTLLTLARIYPKALEFLDWDQRISLAHGYLDVYRQKMLQPFTPQLYFPKSYCRQAFNEYGDMVYHLGLPRPAGANYDLLTHAGSFNQDAVNLLVQFKAMCDEKGCDVAITFPPVPAEQYALHHEQIDRVLSELRSADLPVYGTPKESTLPVVAFYDTPYHIVGACRQARCQQLSECICCKKRGACQRTVSGI